MQFEVPPFLKETIAKNDEVQSVVSHALTAMFPWFLDNKLFFFPEFTDHGVDHINTVLATIESLISSEARKVFTPQDAGATVAAVLLHDCAMHLSWDGFRTLLSGQYAAASALLPKKDPAWPDLFRTFMHRAMRWDQRKLLEVVGSTNQVREPPESLIDTTEVDKRVIGEFVRIHHARLAHEIAILGVPGPLENRAKWLTPLTGSVLPADLIGFIAKSHNLTIRHASDHLPKLRLREYSGIHAPYVMALLRIADYLQIQSKRAHPSLLAIRSLSSTISGKEWKKHAATIDIHPHGDDPEALVVQTDPPDISTLFALRDLFGSMQQELDDTWACLGEIYGRYNAFSGFAFKGLTVRRLQTNIDSLDVFERESHPPYIPIELKLRSAGADMFGLLVKPLYNGDASVAIRELVQNSVDACNERNAYEASLKKPLTKGQLAVKLLINSDDSLPSYLEVSDNGIGMTLETVRDYYLVAGASFRKSGWWKDHFLDNAGKSEVRRSGRFGVGALASFLVGHRTSVTTRHFDETEGFGISFTYEIEDGLIEAHQVPAPIGTTIKIQISSREILNFLKNVDKPEGYRSRPPRYHWYALENPIVSCAIHVNDESKPIKKTFSVPPPGGPLPQGWHAFSHPDYKTVHWSFHKLTTRENGSYGRTWLLCNGILIADDRADKIKIELSPQSPTIQLQDPTVSVYDPDGLLPLNLSRDSLASSELPFQHELHQSMARWLVTSAREAWGNAGSESKGIHAIESLHGYQSHHFNRGSNVSGYVARSARGICFLDRDLMAKASFDRLLLAPLGKISKHHDDIYVYLKNANAAAIAITDTLATKGDIETHFRTFLRDENPVGKFLCSLGRKIVGIRICCSNSLLSIAREKGRVPKYFFSEWTFEKLLNDRTMLSLGHNNLPGAISAQQLSSLIDDQTIFAEYLFGDTIDPPAPTPLSIEWFADGYATPFFAPH